MSKFYLPYYIVWLTNKLFLIYFRTVTVLIIDIFYYFTFQEWTYVVNAFAKIQDFFWCKQAVSFGCTCENISTNIFLIVMSVIATSIKMYFWRKRQFLHIIFYFYFSKSLCLFAASSFHLLGRPLAEAKAVLRDLLVRCLTCSTVRDWNAACIY